MSQILSFIDDNFLPPRDAPPPPSSSTIPPPPPPSYHFNDYPSNSYQQHPSGNPTYNQTYHHPSSYPQEPQNHFSQNYPSQDASHNYPNFQSYPSFSETSLPAAPLPPAHYLSSYYQGSEQPYSPSATRPTDYPSTGQYKPSAGNGSVPAPVPESAPVASQSYQYDSNYQLPLRRLQRHKGQQGLLLEHWRLMTFSLLYIILRNLLNCSLIHLHVFELAMILGHCESFTLAYHFVYTFWNVSIVEMNGTIWVYSAVLCRVDARASIYELIADLPMLAVPMKKEELIVYVAATKEMILFIDGSSCTDGSGAGLILTNPKRMEFTCATNNKVEYEALIAGLRIAEQMGVKNIQANVDSRLVANQVNGTYKSPRSENKKADALSKIASISFTHLSKQVLVKELKEKSIREVEVVMVIEEERDTWMTLIFKYLTEETLPADVKEARAVRHKLQRYVVLNGTLYKNSFLRPWLRCVGPLQANYVLREIHEGSCSMHEGTRSVVSKPLRISYYWPTMHKDARTLIRVCQECQVHKPVPKSPQQKLTPIASPWSFYKWGIDIAGPFLKGPGKVKFLIVAIDYFTKTQWPGRKSKSHSMRRNKSKAGRKEQEFDERALSSIIPAEIGMPTLRTAEVDLVQNNEALEINLDLLEEKREQATIREAKTKAKMEKYYNSKVRSTSFKPRDLVYCNNDASHAEDTGKLAPNGKDRTKLRKHLEKAHTS
nr:reverse transcriptase domain-containing protein [Tanacetum cinerariifolium]